MYKKILLLLISTALFLQAEEKTDLFEILANSVKSKENITEATGDVVIYSKEYYIAADRVIYDKQNNTFELFNNVLVLKDNKLFTQSDYAFLDLSKDELIQSPILLLDSDSKIWLSSKNSNKKEENVFFDSSVLSSCDCIDPDWTFRFTQAQYDTKEKWIDVYNTTIYIKDVPIFYTPYFGFPTDNTRRTGLLRPLVGYSSSEGVLYSQPIYFAPSESYDFEITPSVRSSRGYGLHTTFRWADSLYSNLEIKNGIFVEQSSYFEENDLDNKKHFGYNINYTRSNLFSSGDDNDELLLSINWLNDVDYDSLLGEDLDDEEIESYINYYYDTPEYYFGAYLKYYLDTSLDSNDSTLQELPEIQAHTYSKSIFLDKLVYSNDFKYTNYTRNDGVTSDKYELNIPVSYSVSFFDDYLNLTFKEELTAIKFNYFNKSSDYDNATYLELDHIVSLSSDLIKSYDNYLHTVNLNLELLVPEIIKEEGAIYGVNTTISELEPFSVDEEDKSISFSLNHSLYSKDDLTQIINHKIKQSIVYDDNDNAKLGDLENELTIKYLLGQIDNRLVYNDIDKELVESSSSFTLNYLSYFLNLDYYMSKNTDNSSRDDLESYTIKTGFGFYEDYKLSYYENYNIEDDIRSKQGLALNIDDKCWAFNISIEKEIEATSSSSSSTTEQNIIYFRLTLKPFITFEF